MVWTVHWKAKMIKRISKIDSSITLSIKKILVFSPILHLSLFKFVIFKTQRRRQKRGSCHSQVNTQAIKSHWTIQNHRRVVSYLKHHLKKLRQAKVNQNTLSKIKRKMIKEHRQARKYRIVHWSPKLQPNTEICDRVKEGKFRAVCLR